MTSSVRERLYSFFLIIKESLTSFQKNNNFEAAATLSFYSFLGLIPLLLLALYLLGQALTSSLSALQKVERLFPEVIPELNRLGLKEVQAFYHHKTWLGLFSLLSLIGLITPFAKACRTAFSKIFKFEKGRSYLTAKLIDILGVGIFFMMFVLLIICEILYSLFVDTLLIDLPALLDIGYVLAPFSLAWIVLFFFYRFFIPLPIKWGTLLLGSFLSVFLWSLFRPAFSFLLQLNPHYGFAFGSLKTIFLLVIWAYYSFAVTLLGVEIMANLQRKEALVLKNLFFDPKSARKIPKKFIKTFEPGELVFREGEVGQEMYYILSGAVAINKGEKVIRVLKEGEYFGELAMLLHDHRTATITVIEPDTRLVYISQANFETLLRENPGIVLAILKDMGTKLKGYEEEACLAVL